VPRGATADGGREFDSIDVAVHVNRGEIAGGALLGSGR
jgi:hypothetical protein